MLAVTLAAAGCLYPLVSGGEQLLGAVQGMNVSFQTAVMQHRPARVSGRDDDRSEGAGRAAGRRLVAEQRSGRTATASTVARARGGAASRATAASPRPQSTATATASTPAAPAAALPPVAPLPAASAGGALSWPPPAGYEGFPVQRVSAAGVLNTVDGHGGDVRVELSPSHAVGPVVIKNCRNAVLIGGQIDVLASAQAGGQDQRGIYVSNCTGTVHLEGLRINGAVQGSQSDGIAVNAPQALVQIENVRVDGMRGALGGNHADVFQPWGGVREFRIDRLTGSTNYQGLEIKKGLGPIGRGIVMNANVASSEVTPTDHGGNFVWLGCNDYPLTLDNVYVAGRSDRSFATSIWPTAANSGCPASINAGVASWPGYTSLNGTVHEGRPPSGDFVPAGSVGLGYTSPGYR